MKRIRHAALTTCAEDARYCSDDSTTKSQRQEKKKKKKNPWKNKQTPKKAKPGVVFHGWSPFSDYFPKAPKI